MVKLNELNQGQSMLEVVVAVALISLIMIALVSAASLSIVSTSFSRNQTQASRYTEEASEWLRSEKDASWGTFYGNATLSLKYCLNNLNWNTAGGCTSVMSGTVFKRNLTFKIIDSQTLEADLNTSWSDARGSHGVATSVIFTNWK